MIKKQNLKDLYPLSLMQEGMLFHALFEKDSAAYFEQTSYSIKGILDVQLFRESLNELFKRHDVLRTVFVHKKVARPLQIVLKEREAEFHFEDIRHLSHSEQEQYLKNFYRKDIRRGFDLSRDILMRIAVLQVKDDMWRVVWSHHHILMDGWCVGILLQEFMEIYGSKKAGRLPRLPQPVPYSTYIKWLEKQNKKVAAAYWKNYLAGYEGQTLFPEVSRPSGQEYEKAQTILQLDAHTSSRLQDFAGKNEVTLNTLFQAAWAVLLQKYNNSNDVVFGAVVSGRPPEIEGVGSMVGLFINTLAVRVNCEAKETFAQLLKKIQQRAGESGKYAYLPLAEVQSYTSQREKLINHILVFENYPLQEDLQKIGDEESGYSIDNVELFEQTSYDLTVMIMPGKEITIHFDYNAARYSSVTMERLKEHFSSIINQALAEPETPVNVFPLITKEEQYQLLEKFNATGTDFPKQTVLELFDEQVKKHPDKIAVVSGNHKLTYRQVDRLSDKLAIYLLKVCGIKPEEIIGVMPERSEKVLVCFLGILKAGGVYLPVDPGYPQERILHMLQDSEVNMLLSEEKFKEQLSSFKGEFIEIASVIEDAGAIEKPALLKLHRPDQLAYIIYTSGSTGKPKGVACTHRCLYNLMEWQLRESGIGGGLLSTQYASLSFDVSVQEMLYSVISGGTLHVVDNDTRQDMDRLALLLKKQQVELLTLPFSALNMLFTAKKNLHRIKSLKHIITSGEQLQLSAGIKEFLLKRPDVLLHNQYGPSETHVVTSYTLCGKDDLSNLLPPIGKPVANTRAYILDKAGNIVPPGVTGELFLGGVQVARGYLSRPELTAEKFLPDPFREGETYYRTGDLAKWLPDGNITFLGRIDGQVKIRGFRVELGEIESALLNHPHITEAAAIVKEKHSGVKEIASYIITDKELNLHELRMYLGKSLPDYMIPAYFVPLDKLPLSPNGKIDKQALPEPEGGLATGTEYIAPRNETEQKLKAIWQELLSVEKIGIKDNFFDLGGHSLKATMLISRIHKALDKEVPLREVFNFPTIEQLAAFIEGTGIQQFTSIEPAKKKEYYPLSSAQKRIFILSDIERDSTVYNMPASFILKGTLDNQKLEVAYKKLIERHESLRTSFLMKNEEPVQLIHEQVNSNIQYFTASEKEGIATLIEQFVRPFSLSEAPLLRLRLIRLAEDHHILIFDIHHIISDGISLKILIEDFTALYEEKTLKPLPLQYKDYAVWEQSNLSLPLMKAQEAYWTSVFRGDIPVLELPLDFPRPVTQQFEGGEEEIVIPHVQLRKLKQIAAEKKTTIFNILLAAYKTLLFRYSGQQDIVVGIPVAGRSHENVQNILGVFVNTVAIRSYPESRKTFDNFLDEIKSTTLKALENQDYPFELLVEKLQISRSLNRNPLFDTMFVFQNTNIPPLQVKDLSVAPYEYRSKVSKFDLTLFAEEDKNDIVCKFEYNSSLFRKETIQRFTIHFKKVIETVTENTFCYLNDISLISDAEQKLLSSFNQTAVEYTREKTVIDLFEEQVGLIPDNIAIQYGNITLTYRELNEKSNSFAAYLKDNYQLKPDDFVGVLLERSEWMVIALLGILKAGAAYVPIDTEYPDERISYILDDAKVRVLISDKTQKLNDEVEIVNVLEKESEISQQPVINPVRENTGNNLAYMIYTSGSTGRPKGCKIELRNLLNYISWANDFYFQSQKDTGDFALYTSLSFDLTITSIFSPLLRGKLLYICKTGSSVDDMLMDIFDPKTPVNAVKLTPSHIALLKHLPLKHTNVKIAIVGGEQLMTDQVAVLHGLNQDIQVFNEYGPTETTIGCIAKEIKFGEEKILIGKPIANTKVYILDDQQKRMPVGVAGEICIEGNGVGRGYHQREELNREKFIKIAFSKSKIYRTGDLGRWLSNGNVEFFGRIDSQLKIRGYRIEPGEIENHLLNIENIKEVVVVDREDAAGVKFLCAYYVADNALEIETLKSALSRELPDYMIPSYFVQLEKIPLTPNGKVDRKQLPEPDKQSNIASEYVAPQNKTEKRLVAIWQELLEVEKPGITDNFFELGGHSLKAMVMVSKIHKVFGAKIPLQQLFANPTIRGLASAIAKTDNNKDYAEIEKLPEQEYYQLSPSQTRLWLLDRIRGNSVDYNMADLLSFNEAIEPEVLEKAFNAVVQRHEAIRTNFIEVDGTPRQKINEAVSFHLDVVDLSKETNAKGKIELAYKKECDHTFDLSKDLLLRGTLIKEKENRWHLIFNMHHIVSDGWSMNILRGEVVAFYKAFKKGKNPALSPLRIQYKDYAAWQQKQVSGSNLQAYRDYWHNLLAGELPLMELPYDFSYSNVKKSTGSRYTFVLDNELKEKLNRFVLRTESSLFMVLLSGFNILLQRLSSSEDVIIGTPVAGRGHEDLKQLIGFFLNTVVLRNQVSPELPADEYLKRVRDNTVQALQYQDYPFEQLVDELKIPRDINRFPITSVFFNMLNIDGEHQEALQDTQPAFVHHQNQVKFDLNVYVSEFTNGLQVTWEYKNELFLPETIEAFASKFRQIVEQLANTPTAPVKEITTQTTVNRTLWFEDTEWYKEDLTVNDILQRTFKMYPSNLAVKTAGAALTYAELNQWTSQLARYLSQLGKHQRIAICLEHNEHIAVSIIAILRSGNAYVPVDPDYPVNRLKYIIKESEPVAILTDQKNKTLARELAGNCDLICIDDPAATYLKESKEEFTVQVKPGDEAYVLYTSGSTGQPKGVSHSHKGILHFASVYASAAGIIPGDRVSGFSSVCFDSFNHELLPALFSGAAYLPLSLKSGITIEQLTHWTDEHRVTVWQSVPTVFRQFVVESISQKKVFPALRMVKMTGEASTREDFEKFKKITTPASIFVVSYGATENSLSAINLIGYNNDPVKALLPAGAPVKRTDIAILTPYCTKADHLESGEILIFSPGLTKGYIDGQNNKDIFTELAGKSYYRTGDIGRINREGCLEILGRKDGQVKIRGMRVEISEIEACLQKNDQIKLSVVAVKSDKEGAKRLVAYIVSDTTCNSTDLRNYLAQYLPEHMIPAVFVQLEQFPLTPSGKINRKALSEPDDHALSSSAEYVAPRNATEKKLTGMWQKLLGIDIEKIGVRDNFFELGGHSLKASSFVARVHKELATDLPLRQVFNTPTIEGIAAYIDKSGGSIFPDIISAGGPGVYPVSSTQKRLYILNQFDLESTNYNMTNALVIKGEADVAKVEDTFRKIIERHESFRTSFEWKDGELMQRIHAHVDFDLHYAEVSKKEIKDHLQALTRPFDLARAPLLRAGLIRTGEKNFLLYTDMHHIISDGSSIQILTDDFARIYTGKALDPLSLQYKDYASWQQQHSGILFKQQENYWLEKFSDQIPVLNLPYDFPRPAVQSQKGSSVSFELTGELSQHLKETLQQEGATLYMGLLSVWFILLHKYSHQEDIVTGSPIAGRSHADLEEVIGMFANTLALRANPAPGKSFSTFLKEVKFDALNAYENQDYPFARLVEQLNIKKDLSRNPLFDTVFVLQNASGRKETIKGFDIKPYKQSNTTSKFDLTLIAYEDDRQIKLVLEYVTKLFRKDTVERIMLHFNHLAEQVVDNPDVKIEDLILVSEKERGQILKEFNNTLATYPSDKTIPQLFEEQVERSYHETAVVFKNENLTYRELNDRANQLARNLQKRGVKKGEFVPVMLERCSELIISMLAIMKAGGIYQPVDPAYPEDRIKFIVGDTKAKMILSRKKHRHLLPANIILVDVDDQDLFTGNSSNLLYVTAPDDLAYIIYTSGSTGKPKGVLARHAGLINTACAQIDFFGVTKKDKITQFASPSFDASMLEVFDALFSGATLIILPESVVTDPETFSAYITRHNVTILQFPPSYLAILKPEHIADVRTVITAGEAARVKDTLYYANHKNYFNAYGPTEITICSSHYKVNPEKEYTSSIPIGRPMKNTRYYVLGKKDELLPVGIPGELCIAGVGVSAGYLNRPGLTAEKFVPDPFTPGEKMYRSGDLARWLPDGNIEYLGRIDSQVKIRGFRIELGEIENVLMEHSQVNEAVAVARDDADGNKLLCAYFRSGSEIDTEKLRIHLAEKVPEYMIPAYFIQVENFPLNPNGKVDKKALPAPETVADQRDFKAPVNPTEIKLAAIWEELLSIKPIGVNDNFFDLGGHSLKAAQLITLVHKEFKVQLSMSEFFKEPVLKTIAALIDAGSGEYAAIRPVEESDCYPVSAAQRRMFMINQFEDQLSTAYNIPFALRIKGKVDAAKLEEVCNKLIERHEILRTSFELKDGEPVQVVHEKICLKPEYLQASEQNIENAINKFIDPFDLAKAPLIRIALVIIGEDDCLLLLDMHHIITDGVSVEIIIKEFMALYEGKTLQPLQIQYKDYAYWQQQELENGTLLKQQQFWVEQFYDDIPLLDLPCDFDRPEIQDFTGDKVQTELGTDVVVRIQELCNRHGVTPYMFFLSVYYTLLHRYTNQEDIVIGTAVAGRSHADLQQLIGMFVNTIPLRNYPVSTTKFEQFLADVKTNTLRALENQDYPFEKLVEQLDLRRDISRNPLFDVFYNYQNKQEEQLSVDGWDVSVPHFDSNIAKFDLKLDVQEQKNSYEIEFAYATGLFRKETIERLLTHFRNLITSIVAEPDKALHELEILTGHEKDQLLHTLNDTDAGYPNKLIQELFEVQAAEKDSKPALIWEGGSMSYSELNRRSNQLAHYLRNHCNVQREDIVGLVTDRSEWMLIAILGVLKAGGCYLPIDPDYPEERINYMLTDSGCKIVVTHSQIKNALPDEPQKVFVNAEDIRNQLEEALQPINEPTDRCYIIYTSGSTGRPKGVMISHHNVVRLLFNDRNLFNFGSKDTWTLFHSYCFDFSVWEMYGALLYGGKLVIVPKETAQDPSAFAELVSKHRVTVLNQTPGAFYNFIRVEQERRQKDLQLRYIIFGGEALHPSRLQSWHTKYPDVKLINMYGITETTVHVTYKEIGEQEISAGISNIGSPIPTLSCYIMDMHQNLQPIGVAGELCVGGEGLAKGYLNRKKLTEEKFIPHPYKKGGCLYRSGDLARWLSNGELEYLGRIDHQVKIRGFRIELGEIEKAIDTHAGIKQAVVLDREDKKGEKYLCAYIVEEEGQVVTINDIREHLKKTLPEYMIPAFFIKLQGIPLTSNGKVARKELPLPHKALDTGVEYIGPRNMIEKKLTEIWREILNLEQISIKDNFFELGGHSLKATQVLARIQEQLKADISFRDLFTNTTIEELALLIDSKGTLKEIPEIASLPEQEYYQVSYAQQRLWLMNKIDGAAAAFNMPMAHILEGKLDTAAFKKAFDALIRRHESLRTTFTTVDKLPVQKIHKQIDFSIKEKNLSQDKSKNNIVKEHAEAEVKTPFDLEKGPLMRASLIRMEEEKYVFLLTMHHIISDGWSMNLLYKELFLLYEVFSSKKENPLPTLKIQYKEYATWQQSLMQSPDIEIYKNYWKQKLSGKIPLLEVKPDHPRPAIKTYSGDFYRFSFSKELAAALKQKARELHVSTFVIIQAIYKILLYKQTAQEDILIGTPVAGRTLKDLEMQIGFFINTLPLRNRISWDTTLKEVVERVEQTTIEAYENQLYPFDKIVEDLKLKRDSSRSPLFDIGITWEDHEAGQEQEHNFSIRISNLENGLKYAKYDLWLYGFEAKDGIDFGFEYSTDLYTKKTIATFAEQMIKIAESFTAGLDKQVADIEWPEESSGGISEISSETSFDFNF